MINQSALQTILLAILAAATSALAVSALSTRGLLDLWPRSNTVAGWESLVESSTVLMEGDGSITIIEFSDFQCPFCARAQPVLHALMDKYPGQVTLLYRHFPLPGHPHAFAAAQAAECAGDQEAFQEYHDLLFQKQDSIGVIPWDTLAVAAGVPNVDGFVECLDTERYRPRVERDLMLAQELGLPGTPAFIVNGKRLQGVGSVEEFETLIR